MLSLTLANIAGALYAFGKKYWKWILLAGVLIVVFIVAFYCSRSGPKLDHEQIIRNQEAVRSGEEKRMQEAFVESKVKEAQIDANRVDAELQTIKAKQAAREEIKGMSKQEITDYLEGR